MTILARRIRIAGLVMAGVVSLVVALLLAERVIRPGIIDEFGTVALLGLLLLFVMPGMTAFALRHDRDVALRLQATPAADSAENSVSVESSAMFEEADSIGRTAVHLPHVRGASAAGRGAESRGHIRGNAASERVYEAAADQPAS